MRLFILFDLEKLNIKYILYCIKTDKFKEYFPNTENNFYVGRPFKIGKNDCFSLIRDYYKKELMTDISDCKRDKDWYIGHKDLFKEIYSLNKNDWIKIFVGPPEIYKMNKHDEIVFKFKETGRECHIAVYLGNNMMLHQKQDRYSTIEKYSGSYQRRTAYVARHKNLV